MVLDDTYGPVRHLHLAGQWDAALALYDEAVHTPAIRAQLLVDRHWGRLDDPAEAQAAVDALPAGTTHGAYLRAQMAYHRILEGEPRPDDAQVARAGFEAAAADESLRGWGRFWLGVHAENALDDLTMAQAHYEQAAEIARDRADLLLESYVVRHLGGIALEHDRGRGEALLRRSLHLRAALAARPQTAAAQATLAGELPDGPEKDTLNDAARATANDLGLTWLQAALGSRVI